MSWDEKAKRSAAPQCQLHRDCDHLMRDSLNPPDTFVRGAKWQRDQLRTDEAVERAAEQMFTATQAAYEYWDRTDWNELHKSNQDVYRSDARAAIAALFREEA